MTRPELRAATRADIPDLQKIAKDTGLFPPEMLPDLLQPCPDSEDAGFWRVAVAQGTACGLCWCRPEPLTEGTWNMLALGVRTASQGQGLGAALVADAETHLRGLAQRLLIVDTSGTPDFAGARAFYAACGYDHVATIPDYWTDGDDKVTFSKTL